MLQVFLIIQSIILISFGPLSIVYYVKHSPKFKCDKFLDKFVVAWAWIAVIIGVGTMIQMVNCL